METIHLQVCQPPGQSISEPKGVLSICNEPTAVGIKANHTRWQSMIDENTGRSRSRRASRLTARPATVIHDENNLWLRRGRVYVN
jgi:hypothetical protein